MLYSITLIAKKESSEAVAEIKKYLEEKEARVLSFDDSQKMRLQDEEAIIIKIKTEINPKEIEKIKKAIQREKEIISYLLEKVKIVKKIEKIKEKTTAKPAEKTKNKTKKVLASMQEEEKKIKDLDSTLDKILNE